MKTRKVISFLTALAVFAGTGLHICSRSVYATADTVDSDIALSASRNVSYNEYISSYSDAVWQSGEISASAVSELSSYNDFSGVLMAEESSAEFAVTVHEAGLYAIKLNYVACEGQNIDIEYALQIDGKTLFEELSDLSLGKLYVDIGEPTVDIAGNEIRCDQQEYIASQSVLISDPVGYVDGAFAFCFEQGVHSLGFTSLRGDALIESVQLVKPDDVASEEEYSSLISGEELSGDEIVIIDAEKPALKSSSMLYASCDKTSYNVDPYPAGKEKLNVLGGSNFSQVGQWVEYKFNITQSGYYNIAVKYKQNIAIGTATYRNIYIDGKIPSVSYQNIVFSYSNSWKNRIIDDEDGNAVPVFLQAGEHTLRICVTLGEYNEVLSEIEDSVAAFNEAYLESIMYLTSSPDNNRDYAVEKNLPGVLEVFKSEMKHLEKISESIENVGGGTNDSIAIIERMVYQLNNILEDPETYPKRLDAVKSNITALASLVSTLGEQPLTMDYISVYMADAELKKAEAGFLKNLYNEAINFFASFTNDYNVSLRETNYDRDIIVWIPTGRDQYKVLNNLINNDFVDDKNINVGLKLVSSGSFLPATVAGMGPDVIINVANGDPVNYAVRGAVYDLSQFDDCEEILGRFSDAASVPLGLGNAVYALPETEAFYMMFYRTDILERLKLEVPQTWEDFLVVVTEMQKNNLIAGMPASMEAYAMFLLQNGGSFYAEDTYECDMNSTVGIKTFTYFTDMFTNYSFPLSYDALTRFRMGEMPIVIAEYTFFNTLQVGAPEIGNLWEFTHVPGTADEDGTIDTSVTVSGTACMMLESSKDPEAAWEFMKWWTSAETQTSYGRDMEMILGPSARVATANLEAAGALSWSRSNAQAIEQARESVKAIENVPGSYFLSRHFTNAFRKVVLSGGDAKESLRYYSKIINNEIHTKCEELGVSIEREP